MNENMRIKSAIKPYFFNYLINTHLLYYDFIIYETTKLSCWVQLSWVQQNHTTD